MAEEEKAEKEGIKVVETKESKESKKKPFEVVDMLGHPGRYEIVDTETGEVVDNANGYGYKSKPNAYRAAWYKFGGGKAKVSSTENWWKKHESFRRRISDELFYIAKDCCGADDGGKTFDAEVKEYAIRMAEELGIKDFKPEYLKHM